MNRETYRCSAAALMSVLAMCWSTTTLAGPVWCESVDGGVDAGSLPPGAQTTMGTGPLLGIEGSLGPSDKEDMFKIRITDPLNFHARTMFSPLAGKTGMTDFDTMLWLFDSNGHGILANDNDSATEIGSFLRSPATDGTNQTIPGPGVYFLCITGFGNSALSAGLGIFDIVTHEEVSGPDGPGGALPIIHWRSTGPTGNYLIHLQGAEFAEVPAPATALAYVASLLIPRRRRRSAP
jgi:hypothetical protein